MRSYLPKNQPELKLISLEDVVVEPVRWLWYPYIPLGKLSIIHGDPAEGKTTLALWIAAACSQGPGPPRRGKWRNPYRSLPNCRGRFGRHHQAQAAGIQGRLAKRFTPLTKRIFLSPCWITASGKPSKNPCPADDPRPHAGIPGRERWT